jgi:hypothetical protein
MQFPEPQPIPGNRWKSQSGGCRVDCSDKKEWFHATYETIEIWSLGTFHSALKKKIVIRCENLDRKTTV